MPSQGRRPCPDPEAKAEALEQAQALAGESELAAAYTCLQRVVGILAVALQRRLRRRRRGGA